jgi:hypothetical protein
MRYVVFLCMLFVPAWAACGQNLLANGNFEKGANKDGEPVGWHTRITGVITISEYTDPDNKKGLIGKHFKDGCGYDWGAIRPWVGLFCPKCHQMITTEESSDWYVKNFESVSLGPGRSGQGVVIKMTTAVGENQGVRVCSDFIKAEKGAGYEISMDGIVRGTALQGFVECFAYVPEDDKAKEWVKTLPAECNPNKMTMRIKRTFREHLYIKSPGNWTTFKEQFLVPENKYRFDLMYVSLYAYGAKGEAGFDNVVLRKLSAAEVEAYKRENPPPKDERFR